MAIGDANSFNYKILTFLTSKTRGPRIALGLTQQQLIEKVGINTSRCTSMWAARWRRRETTSDMIIVRYADDIVVGCEREADARRFRDAMRERLGSSRCRCIRTRLALDRSPEEWRVLLAGALAPSVGALLLERAGAPGALATLAGAALARAVRWDEVAQAQSEFVRASLERLRELNRRYLKIVRGVTRDRIGARPCCGAATPGRLDSRGGSGRGVSTQTV